MNVGEKIANRRKQLGWTQEELANKMGYTSKTSISKIESGTNEITQSKILKFSQVLDVSIAYLMGWEIEDKKITIPVNLQLFAEQKEKPTVAGELERMSDEDLDNLFMHLFQNKDKDFLLRLASQILEIASRK